MLKPAVSITVCVLALAASSLLAQEGHPLKGTWSGDWGPSLDDRRHLTLVMDYDGEAIGGVLNPGSNSVSLTGIQLDVTDWSIRIVGETRTGEPIRAEGQIENLESYHRTISGTWREGAIEGSFTLTRD